ncbi:MAG: ribosome maturation factor RimP [Wenzhouxiangellaceae bacterium]
MSVQQTLKSLIQPLVEDLGYEFVGLEYSSNPKNRRLRLFIDQPGTGIALDDCARVSEEVSALLDVEDPIPGAYSLEVSSPGMERPLFEPAHFQRFVGERARLMLYADVAGRRKLTGIIISADDEQVVLEVDGERFSVAYADIRSANLKPDLEQWLSGR